MREAIGGTWIFTIVIVFIVLFSSYLAISVNYSKAFKVKNEIINLIEQNEGMSADTQSAIEKYLDSVGYFVYGNCSKGSDSEEVVYTGYSQIKQGYKYCVSTRSADDDVLERNYYKVKVFFKLDLPIVGNLLTFPITGETKAVYFPRD